MDWLRRKDEWAGEIVRAMYARRLIRTWLRDNPTGWELVSGLWSPLYIQARLLPSHPELFAEVGQALAAMVRQEFSDVNRLVGVAAAGVPLAVSVGLALPLPVAYTRKLPGVRSLEDLQRESTRYGDHSLVEGEFTPGDRILIVDDVASRFDSKQIAIRQVEIELERRRMPPPASIAVAVLIDREQGAGQAAQTLGIRFGSLIQWRTVGLPNLRGLASNREIEVMGEYLRNPGAFQDPAIRAELTREAQGGG